MASIKRLTKEYADFKVLPVEGMNVSLINEADMLRWLVLVDGPENTPYQGGVFRLHVTMPADYPFKPPTLTFQTKIYHPNVANDGGMCLGLLKPDQWKPSSKLNTVFLFVRQILTEPIPDDAVEQEIAAEYKNDRKAFNKNARDWTKKYAKA